MCSSLRLVPFVILARPMPIRLLQIQYIHFPKVQDQRYCGMNDGMSKKSQTGWHLATSYYFFIRQLWRPLKEISVSHLQSHFPLILCTGLNPSQHIFMIILYSHLMSTHTSILFFNVVFIFLIYLYENKVKTGVKFHVWVNRNDQ